MSNDLAVIETALDQAMPTLANILAATPGLPARSFKAAILSQLVHTKAANAILNCSLPSIMNCAATFSGLGLMPDGVSGQAYILPFKGIATPVVGYMGYNTLGERAGRTITGDVWREGDVLEYEYGSRAFVSCKPVGPPGRRRIEGAWADASAKNRTPIVHVMYIEELEQVRERSPAGNYSSSPWMDLVIGRPAMYAKTAKRRLKRSMPLLHGTNNFVTADALETQFELTERPHYLLPGQDGQLHITDSGTGEQKPVTVEPPAPELDPTRPVKLRAYINSPDDLDTFDTPGAWMMAMLRMIGLINKNKARLQKFVEMNNQLIDAAAEAGFENEATNVRATIKRAMEAAK